MEKVNVCIKASLDTSNPSTDNTPEGNSQIEVTAANDTVTAFFKAYTKLSPKIKKAKSKEALNLVEDIVSSMNKLSRLLGKKTDAKKGSSKKGGFSNVKHAPAKERKKNIEEGKGHTKKK